MAASTIAVAAMHCPTPTFDVYLRASQEARGLGLRLVGYLGRRDDVLGPMAPPGMCCHIFEAADPSADR